MELKQFKETATHICHLNPERMVVVGVSGGADSLCLLDLLLRTGFPVLVAHFNHHLRPGSGKDAEVVQETAARLGARFVLGEADVAAYARQERLSLEEAARLLRYQFLFDQARSHHAQAVAVGHTADDQVETLLMHLLRGSGLSGLAGMAFRSVNPAWDDALPVVRPLLDVWREETHAYCAGRGLTPLLDESNQDTTFFRNRVRQELVPFLETYNPQARRLLWRTSQVLAGDVQVVQAAVESAWQDCDPKQAAGNLSLHRASFLALSDGLQRGVLRRAVSNLDPTLKDLDFPAVERALRFLHRPPRGGQIDLVQGLRLWVEGDRVVVARSGAEPGPEVGPQWILCQETVLPVPGVFVFDGGWRLAAEALERDQAPVALDDNANGLDAWLDADRLAAPLVIRCPAPGDRFQPLGMNGHSLKLSDFWINQKLPRRARAAWPLVVCGDQIVWIPAFRLAHSYRVTADTRRVLHLWLFREQAAG